MTTVQLICLTPPPSHRMGGGGCDRMCGAPSHGGGAAAPGSASYHQKELHLAHRCRHGPNMLPSNVQDRTIPGRPRYAVERGTCENTGDRNVSNGFGHPRHDCNIVSTFGDASAPGPGGAGGRGTPQRRGAALLDLGGADTRGYTAVSIAPSELS